MTDKKRTRCDSAKGAGEIMTDAIDGPHEPPEHVSLAGEAMPFWYSLMEARAKHKWNNADLETAANLARCKYDIERMQAQIYAEGDVIENQRGTPIVNPKHQLLETLSRRSVALSRMLHVHAEATLGKAKDQVKGNKAASRAAQVVEETDDGLIPGMNRH